MTDQKEIKTEAESVPTLKGRWDTDYSSPNEDPRNWADELIRQTDTYSDIRESTSITLPRGKKRYAPEAVMLPRVKAALYDTYTLYLSLIAGDSVTPLYEARVANVEAALTALDALRALKEFTAAETEVRKLGLSLGATEVAKNLQDKAFGAFALYEATQERESGEFTLPDGALYGGYIAPAKEGDEPTLIGCRMVAACFAAAKKAGIAHKGILISTYEDEVGELSLPVAEKKSRKSNGGKNLPRYSWGDDNKIGYRNFAYMSEPSDSPLLPLAKHGGLIVQLQRPLKGADGKVQKDSDGKTVKVLDTYEMEISLRSEVGHEGKMPWHWPCNSGQVKGTKCVIMIHSTKHDGSSVPVAVLTEDRRGTDKKGAGLYVGGDYREAHNFTSLVAVAGIGGNRSPVSDQLWDLRALEAKIPTASAPAFDVPKAKAKVNATTLTAPDA